MRQMKLIVKIIQTFPPSLVISQSRFPLSPRGAFLVAYIAFLARCRKKARNGMRVTSCVRAKICQLWWLQPHVGQGQKLPRKMEEMVEQHLFQLVLVIE